MHILIFTSASNEEKSQVCSTFCIILSWNWLTPFITETNIQIHLIIANAFFICNVAAESLPGCKFQNENLECKGEPVAQASRWGPSDKPTDMASVLIGIGAIVVVLVLLCYCCQFLSCWTSKEYWTDFDEHYRQRENLAFWKNPRRPVEDDSVSIEERTTTTTATAASTPSSDPQPSQSIELPLSSPLNPEVFGKKKGSRKFGDCVIDMCTVF
ncbi:General transcriptional corepressor trfA [Orchesella cincta]|uniref:General transcriptional corepressor trfA n=1 Tax=Orchesella cincta TaxID=48709 RepID=A0A1D2MEC1_ORCCI|nr:General transcriptional corepressor trfA [Orchesella cincta]